ncbi:MAG: metal-dependent transcriptional regulator [Bowdeniella nasicola]|nr:metal-dependent transcriptional regulator [Bowdeniella nasicola]
MQVSQLSESSQNYVKAIWNLGEWDDTPVTASVIAARVGVKLSTASDAIRKLTDQGLVSHAPYGAVSLTEAGRAVALQMVRRHRLIETFLVQTLGYRWDQVHDEAETLEHAVSDFMVERIAELLGHPDRDPHGDPIPAPDGSLTSVTAEQLSAITPPAVVRVERIADDDPQLLQYFTSCHITVGSQLTLDEGAPYSGGITIEVAGERIQLGDAATTAVWVRRED